MACPPIREWSLWKNGLAQYVTLVMSFGWNAKHGIFNVKCELLGVPSTNGRFLQEIFLFNVSEDPLIF